MAKVHPQNPTTSPPPTPSCIALKREVFTIWMKSLVCHTNGCTVFDSKGQIVYRVDNYDTKCRNEVHLMDHSGNDLYTIRKKSFPFGRWYGYRSCSFSSSSCENEGKPCFQAKISYDFLTGSVVCKIKVGCDLYLIDRKNGKATFRIVNVNGDIVAEAKQKSLPSGICLGEDVLKLKMNSDLDHSLIMAFVTVYGLIFGRMSITFVHKL